MRDQPRADTYEATRLFRDGAVQRPGVPGRVAWDEPIEAREPAPVTAELLAIGRDRFVGFCAPCHGADGYGLGVVAQRGFPPPPSLHEPRLRDVGDDHIRRVIIGGLGKMPAYGPRLRADEVDAVVAYVRALQFSQHADADRLPRGLLERLGPGDGGNGGDGS